MIPWKIPKMQLKSVVLTIEQLALQWPALIQYHPLHGIFEKNSPLRLGESTIYLWSIEPLGDDAGYFRGLKQLLRSAGRSFL